MLESNVFRFMMLIGSVIVMAALVTGVFYVPMVQLDDAGKENYELFMGVTLEDDKDWLSMYEAGQFKVKSVIRRDVTHY